jgi:PHD/YefM family antitoxin component YafN of YafNO toxin-antitoxin module
MAGLRPGHAGRIGTLLAGFRGIRGAAMSDNWQAAQARARFAELVAAAIEGRPQFIRRRDGHEVVLVSRDYFERTKLTLKTYLLSAGYAGDEPDAFDAALADATPRLQTRATPLKE